MKPDQVLAWLVRRQPQRPPELAALMDRAVCEMDRGRLAETPTMAEALASLGLELLARVNGEAQVPPSAARDQVALELLAADAFVTYAFEAAGEDRNEVGPLVARLLNEAA